MIAKIGIYNSTILRFLVSRFWHTGFGVFHVGPMQDHRSPRKKPATQSSTHRAHGAQKSEATECPRFRCPVRIVITQLQHNLATFGPEMCRKLRTKAVMSSHFKADQTDWVRDRGIGHEAIAKWSESTRIWSAYLYVITHIYIYYYINIYYIYYYIYSYIYI